MEVEHVNKLYDMNAGLVQTMGVNNPEHPNLLERGGHLSPDERDKVSEKIRVLMNEGYPHKQAVAIALNMQNRGVLATGGDIPTKERVSFNIDDYKNPYELNKAIEKWINDNVGSFDNVGNREYTFEEKMFIKNYTGYGGLNKYGSVTIGSLFEFFTPKKVIEKMWALAYKHGYKADQSILEPSVGTGEFLAYADPKARVVAYEINEYSAIITKILYPFSQVKLTPFETVFIDKRNTIKGKVDNLEKFDLVIGNCPYGDFSALDPQATQYLLGFGEQKYTQARNYVEYFLRRSLDLLNPGGLLIMIIGAEVRNGGMMFLDGEVTPVKEYLNEHSELLEAYRLPDSTFERTGVTSDILVIKKKGGEKTKKNNGELNRLFLGMLEAVNPQLKTEIISTISKHYGQSPEVILNEITDIDAEGIMEYIVEPTRTKVMPYYSEFKTDFNFG